MFNHAAFIGPEVLHEVGHRVEGLHAEGRATLLAAVATVWTTIAQATVLEGRRAFVTGYGLAVENGGFVYDGGLRFRVVINGVPIPGLDSFSLPHGSMAQLAETARIVEPGGVVQFQARRFVLAGGTTTVQARLLLLTWPALQPRGQADD